MWKEKCWIVKSISWSHYWVTECDLRSHAQVTVSAKFSSGSATGARLLSQHSGHGNPESSLLFVFLFPLIGTMPRCPKIFQESCLRAGRTLRHRACVRLAFPLRTCSCVCQVAVAFCDIYSPWKPAHTSHVQWDAALLHVSAVGGVALPLRDAFPVKTLKEAGLRPRVLSLAFPLIQSSSAFFRHCNVWLVCDSGDTGSAFV